MPMINTVKWVAADASCIVIALADASAQFPTASQTPHLSPGGFVSTMPIGARQSDEVMDASGFWHRVCGDLQLPKRKEGMRKPGMCALTALSALKGPTCDES